MKISRRNYYILSGVVAFIILINVLLFYVNPREIIDLIGVENSYIVIFITAAIGGLSTFTGLTLFTAIATFAAGGAEPLLLGLAGGLGIFVSDSIFYHLAYLGRKAIPDGWKPFIEKLERWAEDRPLWLVLLATYLYLSFIPLPSDLLMIALALGGYPYRKIAGVLLLGGLTIATLTAYFGFFI
jgi:hypothetical protein